MEETPWHRMHQFGMSLWLSSSLSGGDWDLHEIPAVQTQRTWFKSAGPTVFPSANVSGE
jgi:hypothetical protein